MPARRLLVHVVDSRTRLRTPSSAAWLVRSTVSGVTETIAFGHRVKVGAGSRILAGARRSHPVHRPTARIFGADHRFGAMAIAESRDLDALHVRRPECWAR